MARKSAPPKTKNGLIMPPGVIFYYIRGHQNQPIACVALASNVDLGFDGDYWCRGVSICSPTEQFNRKEARRLAWGRLLKAFGTGEDSDPIAPNTDIYRGRPGDVDRRLVDIFQRGIKHKSGWDVELTDYEKELVEKATPKEEADVAE